MTSKAEFQTELKQSGRYHGAIDGDFGALTAAAILTALTDGPDTPLYLPDYQAAAARLACPIENVIAIARVEANGSGFQNGRPKILFEPHRFHKLTGGRFAYLHPSLSYPKWGTRPYPKTQDGRYEQLLDAIDLDIDAAFSATSFGKFQILGENHQRCGYAKPHRFAFAMARDERTQLRAFELFIAHPNVGVLHHLRLGNWQEVARRYNGSAYAKNRYDVKLAQAAAAARIEIENGQLAA